MTIDTESIALSLYREAAADPSRPPGPLALARALLGADKVAFHTGISTGAFIRSERAIWINPRLPPHKMGFVIAHEIGEWFLARERHQGADTERLSDQIAAAITAPAPAVHRALALHGRRLSALAHAFASTQSILALRIGEVTGSPLALITERRVRTAGRPWPWPTNQAEIARLATDGAPGLDRLPLTDVRRRTALFAT